MSRKQNERWSYSKLSEYEKCPHSYENKYILKLYKREHKASTRGLEVHEHAEKYVDGRVKNQHKVMKLHYELDFIDAKKAKASTEGDFSFTKDFKPCAWNDWDSVWCIAKLDASKDCGKYGLVVDYKTGKVYESHKMQSDIYAIAGFIHMPEVPKIHTEFWYLDNGEFITYEYDRIFNFEHMKENYTKRVNVMFRDKTFNKKPGLYCRWCDRNKKYGGDCDGKR